MQNLAIRRWLFRSVAAASLLSCVGVCALWVRSLGHFEEVSIRYACWSKADQGRRVHIIFSWYSNTLRLRVIDSALRPDHFRGWSEKRLQTLRDQRPPGVRFMFAGEEVTREMNGYRPGFDARHYPDTDRPPVYGDQYVLAVRPWLPAVLTAVLPAIWLCRLAIAACSSPFWQFGLRDLFLVMTVLAVILYVSFWLLR